MSKSKRNVDDQEPVIGLPDDFDATPDVGVAVAEPPAAPSAALEDLLPEWCEPDALRSDLGLKSDDVQRLEEHPLVARRLRNQVWVLRRKEVVAAIRTALGK